MELRKRTFACQLWFLIKNQKNIVVKSFYLCLLQNRICLNWYPDAFRTIEKLILHT